MYILPDTHLLTIKQIAQTGNNQASFEIEPLSPGYGITIGNSLRRILLSSMEGAAISSIRLDGATHEFTTVPGIREDIVTLILNLKQLRMRLHGDEPVNLVLQKKGVGTVTAADFKANASVEFINPDHVIANLDKGGTFNLEVEVRKGRGYSSTESRREDKLPLGTIAIDSIYSPVTRVTYNVDNTRVGNVTNYDKLNITISTDGSLTPREALETAAKIALEHLMIIAGMEVPSLDTEIMPSATTESDDTIVPTEEKPKKRTTRTKKVIETEV